MQFPLVLRVPVPPVLDLLCRRLGFGEMDASHTVALAGQSRKLRFFVQRFVECDVLSLVDVPRYLDVRPGAFEIWNRLSGVHGGHNCCVAFV